MVEGRWEKMDNDIPNPLVVKLEAENAKLKAQLDRAMKGYVFVEHIQWHLDPSQHVICKICGKSVDEIYEDEKDKHWIVEGE
jgi:hypothetical protein